MLSRETVEIQTSNGIIEFSIDKILFEEKGMNLVEVVDWLERLSKVSQAIKSSYTKEQLEQRIFDIVQKYPVISKRHPGVGEWIDNRIANEAILNYPETMNNLEDDPVHTCQKTFNKSTTQP